MTKNNWKKRFKKEFNILFCPYESKVVTVVSTLGVSRCEDEVTKFIKKEIEFAQKEGAIEILEELLNEDYYFWESGSNAEEILEEKLKKLKNDQ